MYTHEEFVLQFSHNNPWHIFLVGDVVSTMDEARRLATEYPEQDYLVAIAETQSAGLGRHARHWTSSSEGLWMTALLRPTIDARFAPWFTLGASVAVAEALSDLGFSVGIKWPNDVLAADKDHWRQKLCGIRCEMELASTGLAWVSLGIGINVNHESFPEELAGKAASLKQLCGQKVSRTQVACAVLDKLHDVYSVLEHEGFAPIRERWLALALGIGQHATVRDDGVPDLAGETSGIVRGMDEEGHLLMEVAGAEELHAVYAGDLVFEV